MFLDVLFLDVFGYFLFGWYWDFFFFLIFLNFFLAFYFFFIFFLEFGWVFVLLWEWFFVVGMANDLASLGIEEDVEYKILVGKTFKKGRREKYIDVRCSFSFFFFLFFFSLFSNSYSPFFRFLWKT